EQLSHVALDYDELKKANNSSELEQKYELSDGQVITICAERFRRTKVLFEPNLIGLEQEGEHKLTFQSIMKCDVYIRKVLYNNIVMISGIKKTFANAFEEYGGSEASKKEICKFSVITLLLQN
ncbi:hypothetical protein RFI_38210, partial [Reticulomyxa filosa]